MKHLLIGTALASGTGADVTAFERLAILNFESTVTLVVQ